MSWPRIAKLKREMRHGRARGSLSAGEKHLQGKLELDDDDGNDGSMDEDELYKGGGNKGGDAVVDDEGWEKRVGVGGRRQRRAKRLRVCRRTEQRRGRTTLGGGIAEGSDGRDEFAVSRWGDRRVDIPFELVGEVAGASAVAEACHVQGSSTARHVGIGGRCFARW